MYRNLILNPVGITDHFQPREHLLNLFAHKTAEDDVYRILFESSAWERYCLGTIGERGYLDATALQGQALHRAFELQAAQDSWQDMYQTDSRAVHLLPRLHKKGLNLYYLCGMPAADVALMRQRSDWGVYAGGVLSCETGLSALDPELFRQLLYQYGLDPAETFFTSASAEQCTVAAQLGLYAIPYRNATRLDRTLMRPMEESRRLEAAKEAQKPRGFWKRGDKSGKPKTGRKIKKRK